jgi:hypothetical protein
MRLTGLKGLQTIISQDIALLFSLFPFPTFSAVGGFGGRSTFSFSLFTFTFPQIHFYPLNKTKLLLRIYMCVRINEFSIRRP